MKSLLSLFRRTPSAPLVVQLPYRPTNDDIRAVCETEEARMEGARFTPGSKVAVVAERWNDYLGDWERLDQEYFPHGRKVTGTVLNVKANSRLIEELIGPYARGHEVFAGTTRESWVAMVERLLHRQRRYHEVNSLAYWSYKLDMADPVACPIRYRMCEAFLLTPHEAKVKLARVRAGIRDEALKRLSAIEREVLGVNP